MEIHQQGIYHIYNRGNNKQRIFFKDENYLYFLTKSHRYIKSCCEILAWNLMPNHFHFLVNVTPASLEPVKSGGIIMPAITNGFRLLQSSYAKGINQQLNRSGNLFQQKTKAKFTSESNEHSITVFHYIHRNPLSAGLVARPEEWNYSSYRDYIGLRSGTLCNKQKAFELLGLSGIDFYAETMKEITQEALKGIF